ncbi:AI-2E family transporter [Ktedonobacter sp. SOSP1-52]|uniref:AI-2E family transporter n=1 Tax=Ktedonobacter sp. SOSP1-52 TaxID=2778366 RepID=UPI001916332B|nr:AI-2E family transporter [Ktedonobacter sp. SOSP1-52]GHO63348.1 AI-2E family transporter [Ktedonobacter sp. SOSP1-52]
MSTSINIPPPNRAQQKWRNWLVISATLLIWVVLAGILLWVLGQISRALIIFAIAALFAYALYPLVKFLQRILPRPVAIAIVYVLVLSALMLLLYSVANTIVDQLTSLTQLLESYIHGPRKNQLQGLIDGLQQFGLTRQQITSSSQQLVSQLQGAARNVVPVVSNLLSLAFNTILVALLSIYLLFSGPRTVKWLRNNTPTTHRARVSSLIDIVSHVVGGYIRGNILLALVISTLTGVGLALIGAPYPFLLATVAFVMEFIPVIGIYITSFAILLLAISKGWLIVVLAVGLMLLLQLLENNLLAPRILGGSIGLSPIVTILALIIGSDLFGIAGAFFAAPTAGLIQALVQAFWTQWRKQHIELFPEEKADESKTVGQTP